MKLRVVKLGGSLFDLPDLGRRVENWLAQQDPQPTVLIAGGGMFVDAVRRFDEVQKLPVYVSHLLALGGMKLASQALSALLPDLEYVSEVDRLGFTFASISTGNTSSDYAGIWCVVDYWLSEIEPTLAGDVPVDWTLTSDSIVAILSERWQADSIVLLKSCEQPGATPQNWRAAGAVDPQFAELVAELNVSWVNLRASKFGDDRA